MNMLLLLLLLIKSALHRERVGVARRKDAAPEERILLRSAAPELVLNICLFSPPSYALFTTSTTA